MLTIPTVPDLNAVKKSVSFPADQMAGIDVRCGELGLSLSAYLQQLVANDLEVGGEFVIRPRGGRKDSSKKPRAAASSIDQESAHSSYTDEQLRAFFGENAGKMRALLDQYEEMEKGS